MQRLVLHGPYLYCGCEGGNIRFSEMLRVLRNIRHQSLQVMQRTLAVTVAQGY
jgi:hypothetical protein